MTGGPGQQGLFESAAPRPLADRMRPATLEEVVGQDHVTTPLRNAIRGDRVPHGEASQVGVEEVELVLGKLEAAPQGGIG